MPEHDFIVDFMFSGGEDMSEGQFIGLTHDALEVRGNTEKEAQFLSRCLVRAALKFCEEHDPLGYAHFLTWEVLETAGFEMKRAEAWRQKLLNRLDDEKEFWDG